MFKLNKDDVNLMWDDIVKFLSITIIIQLLMVLIDNNGTIFGEKELKFLLYIAISFVLYHLVIKQLMQKPTIEEEKEVVPKGILKKHNSKTKSHKKVRFQEKK